jgi:hypothetical protein
MTATHSRLPAGERLIDLLDDPIGQMVMDRDGVTREQVLQVMTDMRHRLFGARNRESESLADRKTYLRLAA